MVTVDLLEFTVRQNIKIDIFLVGLLLITSKMLHLEHGFVWCWNLDASGSRSENKIAKNI